MDISLHKQEQPIANTDTVLANSMATTLPSNLANGKAGPSDKEFESLSIEDSFADAATDQVYEAKANKLNEAIQAIGMGRYQWQMVWVVGFGWANDNMWPIVTSLIFTPIANEFRPKHAPLLLLAQNLGLLIGAMFWGFGCDVIGRRHPFNLTLLVTAIFGMVAACAPNFATLCLFLAMLSFGVGGNLPVDSAVILEFLPGTHQWILTALSAGWALSQLVATLVAWPLLGKYTCEENEVCTKSKNVGWRYFIIAMGGISMIAFVVRYFFFTIFESPKYLMGKGKDEEAVRIVHEIARRNGKTTELSVQDLYACDPNGQGINTEASAAIQRKLENMNLSHIKALFRGRKMALSTTLIMIIWAFLGLAFPLYNAFLPFILATRGAEFGDGSTDVTYRSSLIVAAFGLPGALAGAGLAQIPRLGRKGALILSMLGTGAALFGSTFAQNSTVLLRWQVMFNFCSNIMFAVLYTYTPEIFPTKDRGTGNALTATCSRIFGLMAPLIAMYSDFNSPVPVYVSGGLFVLAGLLVPILPYESQGKASL